MVFGVARDVTERLAFEAEMSAAKQAAEAANQAKSNFLANMSHEIRTPLNGVIGVVDALRQTVLTPAQREMVDLIKSSGVTLERLVSDILDVSKIEAGRLEIEQRVFDLRDELGSLVDLHRIRAHEKSLSFRSRVRRRPRAASSTATASASSRCSTTCCPTPSSSPPPARSASSSTRWRASRPANPAG